ncbi:hypothetical protein PtB15_8B185 [Puccinia triticina]|nr:hypothetical protein PtB15_8B185 [Puccinia triticina]
MVGSISPGALEPISAEASDTQQHQQLGDLVVRGFRILIAENEPEEYTSPWTTPPPESAGETPPRDAQATSSELISSKTAQLTRFRTNQPGSQLKQVLDLQPELELMLDQVRSFRYNILSRESSSISESCDQHLKELKAHRLSCLDHCIGEHLVGEILAHWKYYIELIQNLGLSSETSQVPSEDSSVEPPHALFTPLLQWQIKMIAILITGADFQNSNML